MSEKQVVKTPESFIKILGLAFLGCYALSTFMKPFADMVEKIKESLKPVINNIRNEIINIVDTMLLNSELVRNYWLIMDGKLFETLKNSGERSAAEIEKIIIDYYTQKQFANINTLFAPYREMDEYPGELAIVDSCIQILKDNDNNVSANVVIPTLLSLITRFYDRLPSLVPEGKKAEIKKIIKAELPKGICPLSKTGKKPKECKFTVPGNPKIDKDIFDRYMQETSSYCIYTQYYVITTTFLNGKQVDKLQDDVKQKALFRHKILHGIELNYASLSNVIKCFMELSFLMKLHTKLSMEKSDD